jgi:hypothetical protein
VRVGAAQERQVGQARHGEIVHETAPAGEEWPVLPPPQRAPDPGHRLTGSQAEETPGGAAFDLLARRLR